MAVPVVELSALSLDPAGQYRREPRRPPHLRPPGYDDEFDWFTIFYDVFRTTDANTIWFVGPPAGTLTNKIGTAIHEATRAAPPDIAIWNMDRCTRILGAVEWAHHCVRCRGSTTQHRRSAELLRMVSRQAGNPRQIEEQRAPLDSRLGCVLCPQSWLQRCAVVRQRIDPIRPRRHRSRALWHTRT